MKFPWIHIVLCIIFCLCNDASVYADGNFKGQLTAHVASSSIGKGLVYVDDKDQGNEVSSDAKTRAETTRLVTFEIHALPNSGYAFSAWKSADDETSETLNYNADDTYVGTVPESANIEFDIYAFFSAKNYTVTFFDGYTDISTQANYTIESTQLTLPAPAHRNNYRFDGWKVSGIDSNENGQWVLNALYTGNSIDLNHHYGNVEMTAQWFETTPGYLSLSADGPSDGSQSLLCSIIRLEDNQKVNDVVIRNNTVIVKLDPGEYRVIPDSVWRLNHSFDAAGYDVTIPAGGNASVAIYLTDKPQSKRFTETHQRFTP